MTAIAYARASAFRPGTCYSRDDTAERLESAGLILRRDCQFHWYITGYECSMLPRDFHREKRKKAKRERRRVAESGIQFDTLHGGDMNHALWDCVYPF